MKIAAFILTTTASLAAAVVLFFGMILAMNGFHEDDAKWGLLAYIILAILISVLAGGASWFLVGKFIARELHPAAALLISVPLFSIVAAGLEFVSVIIGVLIAQYVRTHF